MTILTSPQDGNGARISPRPTLAHVPGVTPVSYTHLRAHETN